jgi:REP element-mobilizing transposase RayT
MSHTHLLYHIVFATKDRVRIIHPDWETDLYKYLGGIIRNHNGEPIEIGGDAEHVHIFARLEPKPAFSDFMRELKAGSSRWVRINYQPKFSWQRRYGAFSVSESASEGVRKYIRNQKEHHQRQTFEAEYKEFLVKHKVDFDEKYLWD